MKGGDEMAAFAFSLPILPGQEDEVRRISELVSGSGELRKGYEESRKKLGVSEEKVWLQRTPIGQTLIVYWETDDPQRTLRDIAATQDEVVKPLRELILSVAPGIDLSSEQPLPNELLFSWQAS
jgi:hypothetical protein